MRKLMVALFLLVAPALLASDFDRFVGRVLDTYGGAERWRNVDTIRETGSVASMMGAHGPMIRTWQRDRKLIVDITYPDHKEVRDLAGSTTTQNGKPVSGMMAQAMLLQWARVGIPQLLASGTGHVRDLGVHDGSREIEIRLEAGLTVTATVDPATFHIIRSASRAGEGAQSMEFVTDYQDFRKVDGLLFAFGENNSAQGMKTATITIDRVEVTRK